MLFFSDPRHRHPMHSEEREEVHRSQRLAVVETSSQGDYTSFTSILCKKNNIYVFSNFSTKNLDQVQFL